MQETLDHFEESNNKNFKRAKIFLKSILVFFIVSIVLAFSMISFNLRSDTKNLIVGIPMVIFMLLSPFGLFYMIRSYSKKEVNTKGRTFYLLVIITTNLLLVFTIATRLYTAFYKA